MQTDEAARLGNRIAVERRNTQRELLSALRRQGKLEKKIERLKDKLADLSRQEEDLDG